MTPLIPTRARRRTAWTARRGAAAGALVAVLAAASTTTLAMAAADTTTTVPASCIPLTRCRPCGPGLKGREPEACADTSAARRVRCSRSSEGDGGASAASKPAITLSLPESLFSAGGEATLWTSCVPSEDPEEEEDQAVAEEQEEEEEDEAATPKRKKRKASSSRSRRPRDASVLVFELGVGLALAAAWPVMAYRKRRLQQGYLPL